MTEPGQIDKTPIKVVPMYIEPDPADEVEPEAERPQKAAREQRPPRQKTVMVGALALGGSVVTVLLTVAAMILATDGVFRTSTVLAWLAIVLSGVAIAAGVWAIVTNRGRRWGIIAVVLAIFANPYLLLAGLSLLGGVRS